MRSLIDFHPYGANVQITNSVFSHFDNCGAVISFDPRDFDPQIYTNYQIPSEVFPDSLKPPNLSLVLTEFAELTPPQSDFTFQDCGMEDRIDPSFEKCFCLSVTDSSFLNHKFGGTERDRIYKTGQDYNDGLTQKFFASAINLKQFPGLVYLAGNHFE